MKVTTNHNASLMALSLWGIRLSPIKGNKPAKTPPPAPQPAFCATCKKSAATRCLANYLVNENGSYSPKCPCLSLIVFFDRIDRLICFRLYVRCSYKMLVGLKKAGDRLYG